MAVIVSSLLIFTLPLLVGSLIKTWAAKNAAAIKKSQRFCILTEVISLTHFGGCQGELHHLFYSLIDQNENLNYLLKKTFKSDHTYFGFIFDFDFSTTFY
ncbi:MAG: hypothetical protein BI182_16070 [Acetobacterium sp. MES1]|jgi:hypothetical protein|nr:MAG: hypothetical protein BI182_16070 [Acetobacterium sp. MES1]